MQWIFSYGLSTDPVTMREAVGSWHRAESAELPDHVYLFTGVHPAFEAGTSTVLPAPGGHVLGVAYLIDDDRVESLVASGRGYVPRRRTVRLADAEIEVLMLEPETIPDPNPPAAGYLEQVRAGLLGRYDEQIVDRYLGRALARSGGNGGGVAIQPGAPEAYVREHTYAFRRMFPWAETQTSTDFGAGWVVIEPGGATPAESHNEEESFIFVAGHGRLVRDDGEIEVKKGDVVYLEPFATHSVHNVGESPLEFLCIWWNELPNPFAATPTAPQGQEAS